MSKQDKDYKKLLKKIFKNNEPIYVDHRAAIGLKGKVDTTYKGDGSKTKPFANIAEAFEKANATGQDIFSLGENLNNDI